MKERLKKIGAALIAVYIIITGVPALPVSAASNQPTKYSKDYNSGTRDVVCTTLNGTSASSYYVGDYAYDNLDDLSASALKTKLNTLMKTGHKTSSYDDCHYKADRTDCQNGDGSVSLIYTSYSATMGQWNGWNREHVWPKSLGGDSTSGGGADLHHIRPSDAVVNSTRGSKKYGYAGSGAKEVYGKNPATGCLGGTYNTYFEPLDNVKGDVARICLYVHVRWGSSWGADNITKVFQSVDVLLEWCELDPVDTWEMGRNEVVQDIQGNRNVFIDYPELAWLIYDREIPSDMITPSGEAKGGNTGGSTGGNNEETTTQSGSTGGNTEETTTQGGTVNPVEPTITPISTIKQSTSGSYTAEGVVVAKNAKSYLIKDDTGIIMVYLNQSPSVSIGDRLRVTGTITTYGGMTQFGNGTTHTKLGTTAIEYSAPKVLNGAACDAYLNNLSMDYVRVVGKLAVSDNYYNLTVDGATITASVSYPANTSEMSSLDGKDVEVVGYVTGITGSSSKYLQIMITDIKEYDAETFCAHTNIELKGAVAADCENAGYTGDTYCKDCGEKLATGTEISSEGKHNVDTWTWVSETSKQIGVCSGCGEVQERECPHENTEIKDAVAANCGGGYTGDTCCTVCGKEISKGEKLDPVGEHVWGKWTVIDGSTVETRECTVCGNIESKNCPHENTEIRDAVAANCGGGYSGDTYCTLCGVKTADGTELDPVGEHTYGDWSKTDEDGKQTRECTVCHATEQRDCTHENTEIKDKVEPNCSSGYTGDTYCSDCGEKISDGEEIAPVGDHIYGDWTAGTGDGKQIRQCEVCEAVESRDCTHENTEIKNVTEASCKGDGYTGDTYCTDCNTKLSSGSNVEFVGDHTYGDWVAVEGTDKERHECTVCGHTQERTAPCKHPSSELRGNKEATDTEDGYTGDTYCTSCGEKISDGEVIPSTGNGGENADSDVSGSVGCQSSAAGGAIVTVVAICALPFIRKRSKND